MYTIYFDTETGGIELTKPTIQLAATAVDDKTGKEASYFEAKIAFNEKDADPKALELNHYDPKVWAKEAIAQDLAVKRFARWAEPFRSIALVSQRTGNSYTVGKLAGYNALTFDLPRLRQMFGDQFFPFSFQVRDVLQRVLFYFDEHDVTPPENFKLSTVCSYFNISAGGAHDALADCRLTRVLYYRIKGS